MACITPATDGSPHLHRRPRGAGLPGGRHRVADGQPSPRLPGVRRGRRVPSAGHDRDDRPRPPPLPLPEAHLPQPGPGPVRQPRDEPLHPVLPLRPLLPRLRRRRRPGGHGHSATRSTSAGTRTASWRASSAATWWRSARPGCSPTRPSAATTPASGTCRRRPRSACTAAWAATPSPASGTACCAGSTAATTVPSTATSSATGAASATSSSTRRAGCARPCKDTVEPGSPGRRREDAILQVAGHDRRRPHRAAARHRHRVAPRLPGGQLGAAQARGRRRTSSSGMAGAGAPAGRIWPRRSLDEGPSRSCSARDLEQADAMLILGEDVTNTAPMLDYSLRQWLRRRPTPEQIALKIPDWNDAAVGEFVHEAPTRPSHPERPRDQARPPCGEDLPRGPVRSGASRLRRGPPPGRARAGGARSARSRWPRTRRRSRRPSSKAQRPIVIVSGISSGSEDVLRAAANVAWSLHARGRGRRAVLGGARVQQPGAEPHGRRDAWRRPSRRPSEARWTWPSSWRTTSTAGRRRAEVDRFLQCLRTRGGARSHRERRHCPGGRRGAARGHLRREHRHLRQQRGQGPALLPGVSHAAGAGRGAARCWLALDIEATPSSEHARPAAAAGD